MRPIFKLHSNVSMLVGYGQRWFESYFVNDSGIHHTVILPIYALNRSRPFLIDLKGSGTATIAAKNRKNYCIFLNETCSDEVLSVYKKLNHGISWEMIGL